MYIKGGDLIEEYDNDGLYRGKSDVISLRIVSFCWRNCFLYHWKKV